MAPLTSPLLVATSVQLQALLARLQAKSAVAVDTEANSLYAYTERVCLVQISIPGADFLIDPRSTAIDLSPLRAVFADPSIEKVFHACEYDVISLRRDFDFTFANLFDTMWAARILGWPRVGLADILKEHFGVTLDKRWQRYNWGQRPLPREALAYARLDTHYLLPLRDLQLRELRERERLEEAREVFADLAQSAAATRAEAERADGFWRVKGVYDLEPLGRALLRELYLYREREARRLDRPPFKVISDQTLLAIAGVRPTQLDQLRRVPGLSAAQAERHGSSLLQAVARGKQAMPPDPPPRKGIDPAVLDRYERLREWRKQAAAERGVEADVIVSNATLMALAHRRPRALDDLQGIDGLGPWRRRTYGQAILEILR
ncbi:MAG TPA: HRDC domain-containing protein [Anaerolineae bacterium]|nr:HRDC domain-containing protein [Anaerolineae bacterium]